MSNPNVNGIAVLKEIQTILQREGLYRGKLDGLPGPLTEGAINELMEDARSEFQAEKTKTVKPVLIPQIGFVDERSQKNIDTLLPQFRPIAANFVLRLSDLLRPFGVVAKIISGTRTYEEQNELYAKGRTKPGSIVTNARAGYSHHNFGIAFDIGLFRGADYLEDGASYDYVGKVAKEMNLVWGGNWRSIVDKPHVEYPTGLTLAQMRQRKAAGQPLIA